MKRVNLVEYFSLAETLSATKRAVSPSKTKGGNLWFGWYPLADALTKFVAADNGFSTSKHVATELAGAIAEFNSRYLMTDDSPPSFKMEALDEDFNDWQYSHIGTKIDAFKSVFEAECRDVEVYSVGQVSIYKTSSLVSDGAGVIPHEMHKDVPSETLSEFNNAGKCLAFDLPTACGFHALRGLELTMEAYLRTFEVKTGGMKSWNDYIKAAEKLIKESKGPRKPSAKVAAMFDRMRELDRNPLMHPRDTLDSVQADMLFRLCAITVVEIARDMKANPKALAVVEGGKASA